MQTGEAAILGAIILILAAAILIWLLMRRRTTQSLRDRYGDEYDRTLEARGGRPAAEADLKQREERVRSLDIRPLSAGERDRFIAEWKGIKGVFVDSPAEAVLHADRLAAEIMQAKGYPVTDFDHRYEDLTVDHGEVARNYRAAHEICEKQLGERATTEELRQAIRHYELLVNELTADEADPDAPANSRPTRAPETPMGV